MLFLPVEVLELIVQATEIPDQLTLCISSKVLNELAVRSLYRRIDLAQPLVKAIRCCKTLVSNEAAALSVRSIRIGDGVSGSHYLLQAYRQLVGKVLKLLPRVVELALKFSSASLTTTIDHCIFPNLRVFIVSSPSPASVLTFIRRHPQIRFLSCHGTAFHSHDVGNIDLPALMAYSGPAKIIPNLLAVSPIRKLNVVWNIGHQSLGDEGGDYDRIFASLAFASIQYLDVVVTNGWSVNLVSAISKSFPLLKSIVFRKGTATSGGVTFKNLCDSLHSVLPSFQHLLTVILVDICTGPRLVSSSDLHNEFKIVTGWGNICPSLNACTLSSGLKWFRMPQVWFPRMEVSNRYLIIEWQFLAMDSGQYPALTKFISETAEGSISPAELLSLKQFFLSNLRSGQAITEDDGEIDVASDGDSDGEEASDNADADQGDDNDIGGDSDGEEEGSQDGDD